MSTNGKFVVCRSCVPGAIMAEHVVSREICFFRLREDCEQCPNAEFSIYLPAGLGDILVACPRWGSDQDRLLGAPIAEYITIRRETCLKARPFPWCAACSNSHVTEVPRTEAGWFEAESEYRKTLDKGKFEV
jgi:hypothetical protein